MRSSVEIAPALAKLARAESQARFALARALTLTAKDAAAELTAALPEIFDAPTPFTRRAIAITPARKDTLVAEVFVKDVQARYLARQEVGGVRRPEPGAPVVLPVRIRTNVYGNIARGRIAREREKPTTFVSKQDTPKTRHLPPGIYERADRGNRRQGGRGTVGALRIGPTGKKAGGAAYKGKLTSLKLLVALERQAQYRPRFGMKVRVARTVRRVFAARFAESVEQALRTAR